MVMNSQMNLPAMQRIMMEFEKQSEKMDMKEEMMNDTLDSAFEEEGEEQEVIFCESPIIQKCFSFTSLDRRSY